MMIEGLHTWAMVTSSSVFLATFSPSLFSSQVVMRVYLQIRVRTFVQTKRTESHCIKYIRKSMIALLFHFAFTWHFFCTFSAFIYVFHCLHAQNGSKIPLLHILNSKKCLEKHGGEKCKKVLRAMQKTNQKSHLTFNSFSHCDACLQQMQSYRKQFHYYCPGHQGL